MDSMKQKSLPFRQVPKMQLGLLLLLLLLTGLSFPLFVQAEKMTMHISPIIMISQEYTDNFYKTQDHTQDEWITSYYLGAVIGCKGKKSDFFLEYAPEYKDYYHNNAKDSLEHNARALFHAAPSKKTQIQALLVYDGHGSNDERQNWRHNADLSMETQLSKTLTLSMEETYSRQFQRQKRTGLYKENDTNHSRIKIERNYGENNTLSLHGEYSFIDYIKTDQDSHTQYKAGASLTHWLSRLDGIETSLSYTKRHFDNDPEQMGDDDSVASGYMKYFRKLNPKINVFAKYRHYYSERKEISHHVFHPSVGFDWAVSKDSGISIGVGALFNQWNNENEDEVYPFLELDIYKELSMGPRASILFTASSRYDSGDEQAVSMGYNALYEGAVQFDYQLTRRVTSQFSAQYEYQKFYEERVNRVDQQLALSAGLKWRPLEWLQMGIDLRHEQIFTDSNVQEYKVNSVSAFARFLPKNPDKTRSPSGERRLLESPFEQATSGRFSR